MSCSLYNKEPMALAENMNSYFKETPPDCNLFSKENCQIPIHKELLYQTSYMRAMVRSVNLGTCCSKIEMICPEVSKRELEILVRFFYTGTLSCIDENVATKLCENLTKCFGFPSMHIDMKSKVLKSIHIQNQELPAKIVNKTVGLNHEYNGKNDDIKEEVQDSNDNLVSTFYSEFKNILCVLVRRFESMP